MFIRRAIFSRIFRRRELEFWFTVIGGIMIIALVLMSVLAPYISPYDPTKSVGPSYCPPCEKYPLGTDKMGRDMLSRIIHGGRIALYIGIVAAFVSMAIGVPLGLISGYAGGTLDRILSLIMDSIYAFPGLVLAIIIAAMLGPNVINVIIAIAIIYVPTFFRVTRGQVLSIREEVYVEAARALGAGSSTVLLRYIFPNVIPNIAVIMSLCIADAILTEAGLTFIGLGPVVPPTPDWGYDLTVGRYVLGVGYWWIITFPGFMIFLAVLAFSLFGEGLNELLNPTLRER